MGEREQSENVARNFWLLTWLPSCFSLELNSLKKAEVFPVREPIFSSWIRMMASPEAVHAVCAQAAEGKEWGRRATGSGQTGELDTTFSKASSVWPGLMVALREFESVLDHSNISRENRGLKFHLIISNFKILLMTSAFITLWRLKSFG